MVGLPAAAALDTSRPLPAEAARPLEVLAAPQRTPFEAASGSERAPAAASAQESTSSATVVTDRAALDEALAQLGDCGWEADSVAETPVGDSGHRLLGAAMPVVAGPALFALWASGLLAPRPENTKRSRQWPHCLAGRVEEEPRP